MKKFASIFLVMVLVLSVSFSAIAASNTPRRLYSKSLQLASVSNTSEINKQAITERFGENITTNKGIAAALKNEILLNVVISIGDVSNELADCSVDGELIDGDISYPFSLSGQVHVVKNTDGTEMYIGGIAGFLNDEQSPENMLTLSLNLNSKTGEAYVPVCLGAFVDEEHTGALLEFGSYFAGLDEATRKFVNEPKTAAEELTANNAGSDDTVMPMAADVEEYGLAQNIGQYNGTNVIYGSYYGTRQAVPSGSFMGWQKAQVNLNNFISAYNSSLPSSYTSIDHAITEVWLIWNSNRTNVNVTQAYPLAQSSVLSFPVTLNSPWGLLNYAAGFLDFQIKLNGVSQSITNNYQSLTTDMWNHAETLTKAITQASNPYLESTTGISNRFYIFNGMNVGQSTQTSSYAAAQISLVEVTSDLQFIQRYVPIATSYMYATLYSVS